MKSTVLPQAEARQVHDMLGLFWPPLEAALPIFIVIIFLYRQFFWGGGQELMKTKEIATNAES